MQVLIVESDPNLGVIWQRHLQRQGMTVELVSGIDLAMEFMHANRVDLVILDLVLEDQSAIALADYVNYRYPDAPVIFVSNASFFSDGSIFQHVANARAIVNRNVAPEDLSAMVEHYVGPNL